MTYALSTLDKTNFAWFRSDNTRATLVSLELEKGIIRGLRPVSFDFEYPISVISGTNGSGKSTILALAACAFHNRKAGFVPPLRKQSYYTFQDFFVQSPSEPAVEGVKIKYGIRHDNWRRVKPGIGFQYREKKKKGKWNDYDRRVLRNVIYFGVQRVVPHYERSTHKSYRAKFKPGNLKQGDRQKIAKIAERILGKPYSDFDSFAHTKYSLPVASSAGISYSGFNMGAGESAIFEILTQLILAGPGTLVVIDEIELGLHEGAQAKLIGELKELCAELKCQVICSSHSHVIISSVPPEGRCHIEQRQSKTVVTKGISADFACGKMGRLNSEELNVFVEDKVALDLLRYALPVSLRKRVMIFPIGSHSAVIRQLASRKAIKDDKSLCVLDGDRSDKLTEALSNFVGACECSTADEKEQAGVWAKERIFSLPGAKPPEAWMIERAIDLLSEKSVSGEALIKAWGLSDGDELVELVSRIRSAPSHSEFSQLAAELSLSIEMVRAAVIQFLVANEPEAFADLVAGIEAHLG